jgi:2-polyprenyl-3-methyl-5-hydroxy-6-metoxy-1,4-benzoquinol methylase
MKQATRDRLNALNQAFYVKEAASFSRTRDRPWPGFATVLSHLQATAPRVLDVGCGNGRLVLALEQRFGQSFTYTGIDASNALLEIARARHASEHVRFSQCDFVGQHPDLALPEGTYDLVALFGVLHHVPGEPTRHALLQAAARRVAPQGVLALTFWRFDRDPRFSTRRLALERGALQHDAPVAAHELEAGDHLLRWGADGDALRYCHFTDEAELTRLLSGLPLTLFERFVSDGANNAQNEYVLLRP